MELLRPGSVPIGPDTVLWFEFLLDQDLLLKHLKKTFPDPSPTELITKFSSAIVETLRNRPENDNGEVINIEPIVENVPKQPAKNIALKFLSLKVAAFIKWSLHDIRMLPLKTQINLLQDLLYFTNEKNFVEIPSVPEVDLSTINEQYKFALLIYHRWLLNITVHRINTNLNQRFNNPEIFPADENVICTPENVQRTVDFLTAALKWDSVPNLLTFDCFKIPSEKEDNTDILWENSDLLSKEELFAQINYELGTFFFYKENYDLAKEHFVDCGNCFKQIRDNKGLCNLDTDMLQIYLRACNGSKETQKGNLLQQLNSSIFNHYVGLINILQQDNVAREIPLVHRTNLELDIQGALSSETFTVAKDFLYKVRALNVVRCILDKKPIYQYSIFTQKSLETLLWAVRITWDQFPISDKYAIKSYLIELILKYNTLNFDTLVLSSEIGAVFDKADRAFIEKSKCEFALPKSLKKTDWTIADTNRKRKPKVELRYLEQKLMSTYSHKTIREILVKIAVTNLGTTVWTINPNWELPIPFQSVLKAMPRGFLQDFSYILLAKSKEQMLSKNWKSSLELLIVLDKELQSGSAPKLSRLVCWETLLVQITQLLDDWQKNDVDKHSLSKACEACLQTNESVLPRTEIIEQCVICLLNLGRWDFLANYEKRWNYIEITCNIAIVCQELMKHKANKKLCKNLWDLVLPIFVQTSQSKRSNQNANLYQDSQLMKLKTAILSIFGKLRNSMAFTVIVSMLTRIYNILKDEPAIELQYDSNLLWPVVLSNANSYNTKEVCENLSQVVIQALIYYPANVPWLRLMGDINFANQHYKIALNYYLKSLLICNDYFNIPVRNDDHVFRRMIKCCISLSCFTQAAVLCQFLEEPDYVLAYRTLSEQKSCNDSVDAYYHCFWDINILEYLIHIHNKKGEFQRRKCATQVIGLLELNSSNNEEIQKEASNLRKSTFLRALCKQYVF